MRLVDYWRPEMMSDAWGQGPATMLRLQSALIGEHMLQSLAAPPREPGPSRQLLELMRLAKHWGVPLAARRMLFEMARTVGQTEYQVLVRARPHSRSSMTLAAYDRRKFGDQYEINVRIAYEVLRRYEEGREIGDILVDLEVENCFPDLGSEALQKRWQAWRRHFGRIGSHYVRFAIDTDGRRLVTRVDVLPEELLSRFPNAKPLPSSKGGWRKPRT